MMVQKSKHIRLVKVIQRVMGLIFRYSSRRGSLRTQLFVTLAGVILLVLSCGSYFFYASTTSIVKERAEQLTLQNFKQAENSLLTQRSEMDKTSKLLLADASVRAYMDKPLSQVEEVEANATLTQLFNDVLYRYDNMHSIYVYTNSGKILGVTRTKLYTSLDQHLASWGYASGLYDQVIDSFPNMNWTSNVKVKNQEEVFRYPETLEWNDSLILASRAIVSSYEERPLSILVLSMKESALSPFFAELAGITKGWIYLLDGNGNVIRGDDAIKRQTPTFSLAQTDGSKYGSYTTRNANGKWQVVYYRVGDTDWTLVKEIPYGEFTKDSHTLKRIVFAMLLVSLFVAWILSYYWISRLTVPLSKLTKAMKQMETGNVGFEVRGMERNEIGRLSMQFNKMSRSIQELIETNRHTEEMKREAEVRALASQINPHFLYNTLNMIKWMAAVHHATNIEETVTALGKMLQPIYRETSVFTTLREELDYIKHYMTIMNHRYGEGVGIYLEVDEALMEAQVPRFILQPLLENCFVHGMTQKYAGTVKLSGYAEGGSLLLEVRDEGKGMSSMKLSELRSRLEEEATSVERGLPRSHGMGLLYVNQRIRLHAGKNYGLEVESSEGNGMTVRMRLPLE
ncbi:MAG: sensor histidine kinase [Gorillibacterium sp.]|nr:sensor histidine kinase [Gorillibacterium sp.]